MKVTRGNDVKWADALNQGEYGQKRKALGGDKLMCSVWQLLPGKKSFPFHAHQVTEEALYVLSGSMKVRTPSGLTEVSAGDYIQFPAKGDAHQLVNDGGEPCVYLGMSATQGVDVCLYPDSGKVATMVGTYPDARRWIFREKDGVEYFDGEKDAGG